MVLNLIDVNQYHTIHSNIPPIIQVWKYTYNFQTFWWVLFCHKYIPYIQFFNGFWIKKIEYIKCKDNQIYLKQTKKIQDVMSIPY